MATRISATIEMIKGQRAAIVELHNQAGNWLGGSRIDVRGAYSLAPSAPSPAEQDRSALYEAGYKTADFNARTHGGTLERFRWI